MSFSNDWVHRCLSPSLPSYAMISNSSFTSLPRSSPYSMSISELALRQQAQTTALIAAMQNASRQQNQLGQLYAENLKFHTTVQTQNNISNPIPIDGELRDRITQAVIDELQKAQDKKVEEAFKFMPEKNEFRAAEKYDGPPISNGPRPEPREPYIDMTKSTPELKNPYDVVQVPQPTKKNEIAVVKPSLSKIEAGLSASIGMMLGIVAPAVCAVTISMGFLLSYLITIPLLGLLACKIDKYS